MISDELHFAYVDAKKKMKEYYIECEEVDIEYTVNFPDNIKIEKDMAELQRYNEKYIKKVKALYEKEKQLTKNLNDIEERISKEIPSFVTRKKMAEKDAKLRNMILGKNGHEEK